MQNIKIEKIRIDGDTQSRQELSTVTVQEYQIAMQEGADFGGAKGAKKKCHLEGG